MEWGSNQNGMKGLNNNDIRGSWLTGNGGLRLMVLPADWVQLQIARSNKWNTAKAEILGMLRSIKTTARVYTRSERLDEKILSLLLYIENIL